MSEVMSEYRYICQHMIMSIFSHRPIIAPMLTANRDDSYYSNFWCGVDERVRTQFISHHTRAVFMHVGLSAVCKF